MCLHFYFPKFLKCFYIQKILSWLIVQLLFYFTKRLFRVLAAPVLYFGFPDVTQGYKPINQVTQNKCKCLCSFLETGEVLV